MKAFFAKFPMLMMSTVGEIVDQLRDIAKMEQFFFLKVGESFFTATENNKFETY